MVAAPKSTSGVRSSSSRSAIALVLALAFHAAIGLGLSNVDLSRLSERDATVEMEVREPPPPPPPEPEPPKPEPPKPEPEPVKPRIVAHRTPPPPVPQPPSQAPPPPNETPPEPPKNAAPPVFGISMDSVVSGDANMAVAVGNTLMTKERKKPPGPVQPYSPEGTAPLAPVPETELSEMPVAVFVPDSSDMYPEEARKLGIEAKVVMRLSLDEKGRVVTVRVVKPVGYGFEEAAKKAMKQARFLPGKTSDGKSVPTTITYTFDFAIS